MGSLVGHVAPGLAFIFLGFWHLFNQIKLHTLHPNSYSSLPWFPTSKIRHLELFLIIAASSFYILVELFLSHDRLQPLDPDGTIPSNHLHNVEHSIISITFSIYAAFAILLDRATNNHWGKQFKAIDLRQVSGSGLSSGVVGIAMTQLLAAVAFAQQLLLFRLHSTDHSSLEGQYHMHLQIIVVVSLTTTLVGIAVPYSFLVSFVRSVSILSQGFWFVVIGYMLWTPELVPKGCFMHSEDGHDVVRCSSDEALRRAKSLANIEFSWFLVSMTAFAVSFYLVLVRFYGEKAEHRLVTEVGDEEDELLEDIELQEGKEVSDLK